MSEHLENVRRTAERSFDVMQHILDELERHKMLDGQGWSEYDELREEQDRVSERVSTGYNGITAADLSVAKDYTPVPSDLQVGGNHYADMEIQPSEFNFVNGLNWCEGNAIKYICRHHAKGGPQDIDKAIHYLQLLKEWQYGLA